MNQSFTPEITEILMRDRSTRIALARQSHYCFFHLYLPHYVTHITADFQRALYGLTEDQSISHAIVVAFRGSGKSTILTLSYPLWAVVGYQQKKFVLILSQTQNQARQLLMNIKREIENNDLLRNDFGALEEETDQWGRDSLVIPKFKARIMAASTEQSIRGSRHWQHRPDLIIVDDAEDQNSVKTREGRNKTYAWFTGEVVPAGDQSTKIIVMGNLLHEDSLLMRLKKSIDAGKLNGRFYWYPIKDEQGVSLWPGKYPTTESIEELQKTIPSESAWTREYELRIIVDQEQVVHPSWLHYYKEIPRNLRGYRYTATGIDLAISQKETADFTAMVSGKVYDYGEDMRVYILPHPINEHLTFPQQVQRVKLNSDSLDKAEIYIEEVGYQSALIQELAAHGYTSSGVKTRGADKRSRLAIVTHLIQNGQILFPEHGCEDLIRQLTGFGTETHDDLADAFSTLMLKVMEKNDGGTFSFFFAGGIEDPDDDNDGFYGWRPMSRNKVF